jgi:hypothetical protein
VSGDSKVDVHKLVDEYAQAAFSAYVDGALTTTNAHDRLVQGVKVMLRAVFGEMREAGHIRLPLKHIAVHGTTAGYHAGCRCRYCKDAINVYWRAQKANRGSNKVVPR